MPHLIQPGAGEHSTHRSAAGLRDQADNQPDEGLECRGGKARAEHGQQTGQRARCGGAGRHRRITLTRTVNERSMLSSSRAKIHEPLVTGVSPRPTDQRGARKTAKHETACGCPKLRALPLTGSIRGRRLARHDPPVAVKLIYQIFAKLLSWMVLRARSDTAKEIEILVLRHQLAVLQRRTTAATDELDRSSRDRRPRPTAARSSPPRIPGHPSHDPALAPPPRPPPLDHPEHPDGRPAIPAGARALILRLATENPTWGIGASTANLPDSATRSAPPPSGRSFTTAGIDPAPDGPVRPGRSSSKRRPRRSWPPLVPPRHHHAAAALRVLRHRAHHW